MKLYQTIDGTLIGFYKDMGAEVQCVMYRDVYEQVLVTKTRTETTKEPDRYVNVLMPAHTETETKRYYVPEQELELFRIVPGYYETKTVYIPGRYERKMVWHPEYSVTRYREVPGHYEIQNIWVPEYYVTRYYWREARPARGLEAAWIPYQQLIPAGYKDQRVWVDTYTEEYQETIPAGERETRVWVDGNYEDQQIWRPPYEEKYTKVVPAYYETKEEEVYYPPEYVEVLVEGKVTTRTIEYQELEEVWVGYEPVYEMIDPEQNRVFEVVELVPAPADRPDIEDSIIIRNLETGEELSTTATYVGLAEQIDVNEYVVP